MIPDHVIGLLNTIRKNLQTFHMSEKAVDELERWIGDSITPNIEEIIKRAVDAAMDKVWNAPVKTTISVWREEMPPSITGIVKRTDAEHNTVTSSPEFDGTYPVVRGLAGPKPSESKS